MSILDFLFPRRCLLCQKMGRYFCQKCRQKIKIAGPSICPVCERPAIDGKTHPLCKTRYCLDGLTSFFVYDGLVRKAIKKIKYQPFMFDCAKELVNLVPEKLLKNTRVQLPERILMVPIPLYWLKHLWRGFNQSEILGKLIARKLGVDFRDDLLRRVRKTRPQVELKGKERKENVAGAFKINSGPVPSRVLLFDDVWTTGATLRACGATLKRAGVKFVWGVTLAR